MAEKKDSVKEITEKLEQGLKELFDSERYKTYLNTMSKFHNYSFNNTLLIAMQKPDATLVAGFNSWQKNFDRHVNKGEKGIRIMAPAPYKKKQEVDVIDKNTGKPVIGEDGKPKTEQVEIVIPAFKPVTVFDVSQTTGKDIPSLGADELKFTVENFEDFIKALERVSPVPMEYMDISSEAKGYFSPSEQRIVIQNDMGESQTVKTAVHEIAHAYREAKQNPADEITFKWLRMNMWVFSTTAWIPDAIYMRGNEPIDMDALEGRDCYAGLDLSSTGDITALVLMFPPRDMDEKYIVLPFFWVPEDTIPRRVKANSVPYDVWEKQGHILATEGNVIHYDFIEKFIYDLAEKYHILEIAVDRWNATQMIQNLEGEGFTIVPFGQGFSSMSAPTKEFYRLLMEGQIIHGGHPVLRWMAGNVVIDTDPAGNIKVTKAKSKEKIDGIVAAIMALDRCIRQEGQGGSVYDERGLLVF